MAEHVNPAAPSAAPVPGPAGEAGGWHELVALAALLRYIGEEELAQVVDDEAGRCYGRIVAATFAPLMDRP